MMDVIMTIDVDLVLEILQIYLIVGLIALFIVLRVGLKNPDDREIIGEKLGVIVMTVTLFWFYNLICWVFSWSIWLMPVSELFKRK